MFLVLLVEADIREDASVFAFLSEYFAVKSCIGIQEQSGSPDKVRGKC